MILRISSGNSEKRNHALPVPLPYIGHHLVLGILDAKVPKRLFRYLAARCPVDRFQIRGHGLALFPAYEVQTGPNQMHDAGLHQRARKDGFDCIGKAFQPISADDERIFYSAVFQVPV